jgi:hypothetical protein
MIFRRRQVVSVGKEEFSWQAHTLEPLLILFFPIFIVKRVVMIWNEGMGQMAP